MQVCIDKHIFVFLCCFNINIVVFNTHFACTECCCLLFSVLFLLSPERKSVTDVWAEAVVTICLYKNIFSMQTQSSALLLLFTDTQHNADHRNIRLHTHDSFCLYFSVSCVLTDTDLVLLQICIVNCVKMFVCVKHLFWGAIKPTAKLYFWQLGLTEFYRGFL